VLPAQTLTIREISCRASSAASAWRRAPISAKWPRTSRKHGSAPDIAGKGIANPLTLLLAAGLMLRHIDRDDLAKRLRRPIEQTLPVDNLRTVDLGGKLSTADFARAVIKPPRGVIARTSHGVKTW